MRKYSYLATTRHKLELNQIADEYEEDGIKYKFIDADKIFVDINCVP